MSYTVVILSCKPANAASCIAAIRKNEKTPTQITLVTSGTADFSSLSNQATIVKGQEPFCFARNANQGIFCSPPSDDIILLNDDAKLLTPGGFDALAAHAKNFGVISSRILGRAGNPVQRKAAFTTATTEALAFVCVYLPRTTLFKIGMFDERFTPGNYEDTDYCERVMRAGMPLGVCYDCLVEHSEVEATFASKPEAYKAILAQNKQRFDEKWKSSAPLLSILLPSIFSRSHFLARLNACLMPQLCDGVEVLTSIDGGMCSIGTKRNQLLFAARGEFVVFLDDDDLVAPDYVQQVLCAIRRNPSADCITYRSKRYEDGKFDGDCIYSLSVEENKHEYRNYVRTYLRWPYHVTPIRRSIAVQCRFPEIDHMEDTKWAGEVHKLLKAEEFINETLYYYFWRSDRSGEQTHKLKVAAT